MQILHLEDSNNDAELIRRVLHREWPDCVICQVDTAETYRCALEEKRFDIILSDYSMPGFDGLEALADAQRKCPATPFLFLSGMIGEERAVEALKRGASDYIIKDRPARLIPAIRQALGRRHTDERLRDQASLLDMARDAILATDLEHRITYWNASAERLYGISAAEVMGRKLGEIGLGFDSARFAAACAAVLSSGEWRGDFRLHTRSGAAVLVESTWSLVVENDGRPRAILLIDTDVTERKKLESQLLRAQRLESVGTLAGGVAHDLNNVLTPILFTIDMLATRVTAPEERRLVEATRVSASHGAALVQQLLSFARGGEGERTRIDPGAALATVEPLIRQSLPVAVAFAIRLTQPPWPIFANLTQFKQALVNLALNARDAMPGGGRLEIVTTNVLVDAETAAANPGTQAGAFLRVSVSDTGSGVPAHVLDRIFDPFFTTKAPGKGTGLGLSVVAGILKSHGGFIQVESELGRGTTFHLLFPAIGQEQPVSAPLPPIPAQRGDAVLLVDDEPVVLDALRALLQAAGYSIHAAVDAGSALREYDEFRDEIGLVITDMMLPDRSGVEVVKELRSRAPSLPIIAISGVMVSGRYDELLRLNPPVECLPKPLPPKVLLSAAERALHARG